MIRTIAFGMFPERGHSSWLNRRPMCRLIRAVDLAIGYKADPNWPKEKPPGGEWGAMSSVAIGPDRNIWTLNRGKIPVQVFTPEGAW